LPAEQAVEPARRLRIDPGGDVRTRDGRHAELSGKPKHSIRRATRESGLRAGLSSAATWAVIELKSHEDECGTSAQQLKCLTVTDEFTKEGLARSTST
jgi:hypothetical protein